ncbi:MAG TPA: nicotinamide riboside transporter PnuC [Bacteroidales bacterium]|nr:nicotinamide riboside transporter PnuC [Bacteroidales bacterium]
MDITQWFQNNYVEVFGAVTGIVYVLLEIRQNIWLWPVGIVTSAVYIWVFFTSKFYADMSLQVYYLAISILGWYWWLHGRKEGEKGSKGEREKGRRGEGENEGGGEELKVTRLRFRTGIYVAIAFMILYAVMWIILSRLTDSPVPEWDSFVTSLSVVATWMLARKIYEHWYLWIIVNSTSALIFAMRGLYPTMVLYIIYGIMSFTGLTEWKKSLVNKPVK